MLPSLPLVVRLVFCCFFPCRPIFLVAAETMREVLARTSVVKDLLTLMTGSDSVEVQGNSAAALGNLASSGKPFFFSSLGV